MPVSAALGALSALYVGRAATAYLDEARRRTEIRRAFEHYVSPAIVAEMTAHPGRLVLGGQRRTLTVMFTDLAGFTTMSEDIAPEAVAQILNEHLTLMTRVVLAHGGTIDKFIGDAVMAFWGAPVDDPAHALNGVRAAIEMQAEMERFRREPGRPELHMRIGLNTGPVVVGNLGSKDRFAYTVIGDAVNLAARLEPLNRLYGTEILLAEETAAAVGDAVRAAPRRSREGERQERARRDLHTRERCGDRRENRGGDRALSCAQLGRRRTGVARGRGASPGRRARLRIPPTHRALPAPRGRRSLGRHVRAGHQMTPPAGRMENAGRIRSVEDELTRSLLDRSRTPVASLFARHDEQCHEAEPRQADAIGAGGFLNAQCLAGDGLDRVQPTKPIRPLQ